MGIQAQEPVQGQQPEVLLPHKRLPVQGPVEVEAEILTRVADEPVQK